MRERPTSSDDGVLAPETVGPFGKEARMRGDRRHPSYRSAAVVAAMLVVMVGTAYARPGPGSDAASQITATGGPVVKSGFMNGPVNIPNTLAKVAKLSLGPGKWAIVAKAFAGESGVSQGLYECRLQAGVDFDYVMDNVDQLGVSEITLMVVHTFGAPGAAILKCDDFSANNISLNFIKITAWKAGTLTNGPLT
jgi:hypothetical protein